MLLFDKKHALTQILGPEKKQEDEESDHGNEIKQCMHELIQAVNAHDVEGAAQAFRAAFTHLETEPHEEAEHEHGE